MFLSKQAIFVVTILSLFALTGCDLFTQPPLCEDPRVGIFQDTVQGILDDVDTAGNRIAELISALSSDSSLINSNVWVSAFDDQIDLILALSNQAQNLQAPRKEFDIFVELFRNGFTDLEAAMILFREGLVNLDLSIINNSIPLFSDAQQKVRGAITEFNNVTDECR